MFFDRNAKHWEIWMYHANVCVNAFVNNKKLSLLIKSLFKKFLNDKKKL